MDLQKHWEDVYHTKSEAELSWHQDEPAQSLALIRDFAPLTGRVVDVGGGSSMLAGRLIDAGYKNVTVLDISASALERAKQRAGPGANRIAWRVGDITKPIDLGKFEIWHDRAVFHFLTKPGDRAAYVATASAAVEPGGHLIIATFALDGPDKCSGLAVERYDAHRLAAEFGRQFVLKRELTETHTTPWGKPQRFTYVVLQKQ